MDIVIPNKNYLVEVYQRESNEDDENKTEAKIVCNMSTSSALSFMEFNDILASRCLKINEPFKDIQINNGIASIIYEDKTLMITLPGC